MLQPKERTRSHQKKGNGAVLLVRTMPERSNDETPPPERRLLRASLPRRAQRVAPRKRAGEIPPAGASCTVSRYQQDQTEMLSMFVINALEFDQSVAVLWDTVLNN